MRTISIVNTYSISGHVHEVDHPPVRYGQRAIERIELEIDVPNLQASAIRLLLDGGATVISCGGGGIPIVEEDSQDGGKRRRGVEAVRASALEWHVGLDRRLLL